MAVDPDEKALDAETSDDQQPRPPAGEEDGVQYDEAGNPICPSSTTERKLMWKIDTRVVPWLCIMYLLAFLGKL